MPNEFIVKNGLISQGNITISGSITATGGVTVSGSIASASYASNAELLDGLDSTVFTLTSSFNAQTASFTAFTSSMNSFSASILTNVTALNAKTASFATTGSNTFVGAEIISGSLAISGSGTPFTLNTDTLEITGSLIVTGSTTLTGSLLQLGNFTTTGTIIAQTINVQTVTSSIVYSSGSNVFGNSIGNSQTFTGSVLITGSLTIAGASSATSYSGTTIYGSTVACSPIGCFATSCATSFIGGTMSGTTIYGSTAVCSPVGKFTTCLDVSGTGKFNNNVLIDVTGNTPLTLNRSTSGTALIEMKCSGIVGNYIGTTGTNNLTIYNASASPMMTLDSGVACFGGTVCVPNLYMNGGIINQQSGNLSFWVSNVGQAVTITQNTGNLGIGCTTPGQSLTVQSAGVATYLKSTATSDSATYGNFQMYRGTCKVGNGVGFALGLINSAAVDTEYAYIGTLIESCTSTQECGAIGFYTTTAGSGRCERLRITSVGNVGMGITSPDYKLHISTATKGIGVNEAGVVISSNESLAANIGGTLGFGATSDYGILTIAKVGGYRENATGTSASSYLAFETRSGGNAVTEKMRISSNGTTTISSTTYIPFKINSSYGQVGLEFQLAGTGFASIGSASNVTGAYTGSETDLGLGTNASATANIIFATGAGSTRRMTITCAGNVGIGITDDNPIENGGTYRNLLVGNGAGYGVFQGISTATATDSTIVAFSGGTTGASANKNGGSINLQLDATSTGRAIGRWVFYTNSATEFAERMRITSAGRVAIGRTSPGTALSVAGQCEQWQLALSTDTGSGAVIGSPSANVLAFGDWSGTERMRITACGTVKTQTCQALGALETSGTIANNSSVSLNLNSAGGNASIGFIAIGATRTDTTACQAVRLFSQSHTNGFNTYTSIQGTNDGGITITNNANGGETIYNCSGATVNYVVRYINLISINSIFERQ